MAGHKKICEKCKRKCGPVIKGAEGFTGVKPNGFSRYKWLHNNCEKALGGHTAARKFLLARFQAEGWKGEKL